MTHPAGVESTISLHALSDGSSHIDWFIDTLGPPHRVRTYRCEGRPDSPGGPWRVEPLPDHRREYLAFEGPISGGRGVLRVLAKGHALIADETPDLVRIVATFGAGPVRVGLTRVSGGSGIAWVAVVSEFSASG